jgi:hypothetical protein
LTRIWQAVCDSLHVMDTVHPLRRVVASALIAGGVAMTGVGLAAGVANADADRCSTRAGCYHGPGMRWCPGDYVWPGLRATGWDLNTCHVYHEQCPPGYYGGCPDNIVEGPPPPPPPPVFRTRDECLRALGLICAFAP